MVSGTKEKRLKEDRRIDIFKKTLVVIDFETTGLDHFEDRITEIGYCKIVNGNIHKPHGKLVNAGRLITDEIVVNKTGITNEMIKNASAIEPEIAKLKKYIGDAIVVAHYANFDIEFLIAAYARQGFHFDNNYICTMETFDRLKLRHKRYSNSGSSLNAVCHALKIENFGAHRAKNDAHAAAQALLKMNSICPDVIELVHEDWFRKSIHEGLEKRVLNSNH